MLHDGAAAPAFAGAQRAPINQYLFAGAQGAPINHYLCAPARAGALAVLYEGAAAPAFAAAQGASVNHHLCAPAQAGAASVLHDGANAPAFAAAQGGVIGQYSSTSTVALGFGRSKYQHDPAISYLSLGSLRGMVSIHCITSVALCIAASSIGRCPIFW